MMRGILLLLAACVGACSSTGGRIQTLEPGMPKSEVRERLGRPDGFETIEGRECLFYYNRAMDMVSPQYKADYRVCFEGDKLVEAKAVDFKGPPADNSQNVFIQNNK